MKHILFITCALLFASLATSCHSKDELLEFEPIDYFLGGSWKECYQDETGEMFEVEYFFYPEGEVEINCWSVDSIVYTYQARKHWDYGLLGSNILSFYSHMSDYSDINYEVRFEQNDVMIWKKLDDREHEGPEGRPYHRLKLNIRYLYDE